MSTDDDRQVRKTREALFQAFDSLVVEEPYSNIRVADVVRRADVGRSTFYEHFRDKDDVLRQSMSPMLAAMASAVGDDWNAGQLKLVLDHFRENRRVAFALLKGESCRDVQAWLAELIEQRLTAAAAETGRTLIIPAPLAGAQIAGSQFGLVDAWLAGAADSSGAEIALAMHLASSAMFEAMFAS